MYTSLILIVGMILSSMIGFFFFRLGYNIGAKESGKKPLPKIIKPKEKKAANPQYEEMIKHLDMINKFEG